MLGADRDKIVFCLQDENRDRLLPQDIPFLTRLIGLHPKCKLSDKEIKWLNDAYGRASSEKLQKLQLAREQVFPSKSKTNGRRRRYRKDRKANNC